MRLFFSSLMVLIAVFTKPCFGQIALKSQEVWPSVDVYLRLNQKWRLYGTASGTKMDESSYADGAVGIFADYFTFPAKLVQNWTHVRKDSLPGKFLWLRFGYQYSATPPNAEDPFKESMLVTEANARFYLPWKMLLTAKNRFDLRFETDDFNLRYRPRIAIERDFKTEFMTFTASGFADYFANIGNSQLNRLRTQLGVEIRVTKHMNYEVFWNHQFANVPEVQEVDAFGMAIKLYLNRKDFEHKIFGKNKKPQETKID